MNTILNESNERFNYDETELHTIDLKKITELVIRNTCCVDGSFIVNFSNLINLDISKSNVLSMTKIITLNTLSTLDISSTVIDDLSFLYKFPNLIKLNIMFTDVTSVNHISYLKKLTYLDISHTSIRDISNLHTLKNMQNLQANNTNIHDINVFTLLPNLKIFDIRNTDIDLFKGYFQKSTAIHNADSIRKLCNTPYLPVTLECALLHAVRNKANSIIKMLDDMDMLAITEHKKDELTPIVSQCLLMLMSKYNSFNSNNIAFAIIHCKINTVKSILKIQNNVIDIKTWKMIIKLLLNTETITICDKCPKENMFSKYIINITDSYDIFKKSLYFNCINEIKNTNFLFPSINVTSTCCICNIGETVNQCNCFIRVGCCNSNHYFHKKCYINIINISYCPFCIVTLLTDTCLNCRNNNIKKNILFIENFNIVNKYIIKTGKFKCILELLSNIIENNEYDILSIIIRNYNITKKILKRVCKKHHIYNVLSNIIVSNKDIVDIPILEIYCLNNTTYNIVLLYKNHATIRENTIIALLNINNITALITIAHDDSINRSFITYFIKYSSIGLFEYFCLDVIILTYDVVKVAKDYISDEKKTIIVKHKKQGYNLILQDIINEEDYEKIKNFQTKHGINISDIDLFNMTLRNNMTYMNIVNTLLLYNITFDKKFISSAMSANHFDIIGLFINIKIIKGTENYIKDWLYINDMVKFLTQHESIYFTDPIENSIKEAAKYSSVSIIMYLIQKNYTSINQVLDIIFNMDYVCCIFQLHVNTDIIFTIQMCEEYYQKYRNKRSFKLLTNIAHDNINNYFKDNCVICHDVMSRPISVSSTCGHYFHTSCICECINIKESCPLCNTHINKLVYFH